MEGRGEGTNFYGFFVIINKFIGFKTIIIILSILQLCRLVSSQGTQNIIGLIPHNYFVSYLNIFNKTLSEFCCLSFGNLFSCENKSQPNVTKDYWVKPLYIFGFSS